MFQLIVVLFDIELQNGQNKEILIEKKIDDGINSVMGAHIDRLCMSEQQHFIDFKFVRNSIIQIFYQKI